MSDVVSKLLAEEIALLKAQRNAVIDLAVSEIQASIDIAPKQYHAHIEEQIAQLQAMKAT